MLNLLVRGLDILQEEENCFYGTLPPTLVTILKKTKAIKTQLTAMATGLTLSLEDAINRCFEKVLDLKDAIISAITPPKFKLKWVESHAKKDHYTQMLIDEMRFHAEANDSREAEDVNSKASKKDFYEFDYDEESAATCDTVEMEAIRYLSDAKTLDCLSKYPTVKKFF